MKPQNLLSAFRNEQANELPFFVFVTLILSGIAYWTIYSTPVLHDPIHYIPFIALMVVHIGLYWFSILLKNNLPKILAYLIFQGGLAFILNLIGQNMGLTMGLYLGLVGIAVGLLQLTRSAALIIGFYLLLSIINFGRVAGWGQLTWWLVAVFPTMLFVVLYVTMYNRQAEARARAQALAADLETANHQLSDYAARVEALTLSNERQRMARELHDTLSQGLAGLILQLEAADAHLASNRSERARAIVQQIMVQARATLADARRAIDDLRLENPGDLAGTVRLETSRFTEATGIPCQFTLDLAVPVPDALCEPAHRAVAEGLTNIARHAQASQVQVRITSADGWLEIEIQDNGIGFEPEAVEGLAGHYGLLGMRERARLAGGSMEIDSQPGSGTSIRLRFPIPPETDDLQHNDRAPEAK